MTRRPAAVIRSAIRSALRSSVAPGHIPLMADEGEPAPDVTAPEITELVAGTQTAGDIPASFVITEAATVDWVLSTSATAPTPAQVAAGQMHTGAAAAGSGDFAVTASGTYNVAIPTGLSGTYYLHLSPIDAANNRSASVDTSGAISIDTLAPTLSSPTDAADGATSSAISVSTNEGNGTLYWVHTTSATPPSAAQVKAGQDHASAAAAASGSQVVSGTGVQAGGATGTLTASTAYYTYWMHEDAQGNQSTVSAGDGFTTAAAGIGYAKRADSVEAYLTGPTPPTGKHSYLVRVRFRLPQVDTGVSNGSLFRVVTNDFALRIDPRTGNRKLNANFLDASGANQITITSATNSILLNTDHDVVFTATQTQDGGLRGSRLYIDGSQVGTQTGGSASTTFRGISQRALDTDQFAIDIYSIQVWYDQFMTTYDIGALGTPDIDLTGGAAYWNGSGLPSGWAAAGTGDFTT